MAQMTDLKETLSKAQEQIDELKKAFKGDAADEFIKNKSPEFDAAKQQARQYSQSRMKSEPQSQEDIKASLLGANKEVSGDRVPNQTGKTAQGNVAQNKADDTKRVLVRPQRPRFDEGASSPKPSQPKTSSIPIPPKKEGQAPSGSGETIQFGVGPSVKSSTKINRKNDSAAEYLKQQDKEESETFKHEDGPFKGKYKFSLQNTKHFGKIDDKAMVDVKKFMDRGYSEKESAYMSGLRPRKKDNTGNILSDEHEFSTERPSDTMMAKMKDYAHRTLRQEHSEKIQSSSAEDNLHHANTKAAREIHQQHFGELDSRIDHLKSSDEYQKAGVTDRLKMIKELKDIHGFGTKTKMAREMNLAAKDKNKDTWHESQAGKIRDMLSAGADTVDAATAAQSVGSEKEDGSYGMSTFGTAGKMEQKIVGASDALRRQAKTYEQKMSPDAREKMSQKRVDDRGDEVHEGLSYNDRLKHYNRIISELQGHGLPEGYEVDELPDRLPSGVKRLWRENKDKFHPEHQSIHQKTLDYIDAGKGVRNDDDDEDLGKSLSFLKTAADYLGEK